MCRYMYIYKYLLFCRETGMEESEIRVGFVTYAKEIHFYNVKVCVLNIKSSVNSYRDVHIHVIANNPQACNWKHITTNLFNEY